MSNDKFPGVGFSGIDSARRAVAVTPHDTNELGELPRGIQVGVTGHVAMVLADDTTAVVFKNLQQGIPYPYRPKIIKSTGTTATDIVALY